MKKFSPRLIVTVLTSTVFFMSGIVSVQAQDLCKPVGWATQNGGVTGGGNASPVVVSNYNGLKSAATSGSSKVIHVKGTITVPGNGRININNLNGKSIIGLPGSKIVSRDMSSGGSGIFYIKGCKNIILRNLVFEGPGAYDVDGSDNLCVDNSQNVWVDHCEFHDGVDGNFDIKNKADFVSVTWCTFSYEKPPKSGGSGGSNDHRYSNLIGSSDNATGDNGHLNVTFNFCWWKNGCRERMPRMRFGKLHMVNNLFTSSVSNHCIRAGKKANILVVGNYFDNQKKPIDQYKGDFTAIKAYDNYGVGNITKNSAFSPPYSLEILSAGDIVTPIKSCAGATLDDPSGCSKCGTAVNKKPTVRITAPADKAVFDEGTSITITADANDEDGTITKVEFLHDSTVLGSDESAPYSYIWKDCTEDSYTLTARATDNDGATVVSTPVTVKVNKPSVPLLSATADTTQVVDSGAAIKPMVFTWGGSATDVSFTALPDGVTAVKDESSKTLTVSGTPIVAGTFSVSTVGGEGKITLNASILIKIPGYIIADWYPFQEETPSLGCLSFTDASIETDYYDDKNAANGVDYSPGALRLNKETGAMKLIFTSLDILKVRFYATGERTLKVTYGTNGTEHSWSSPEGYESGAHEIDLTTLIPELVTVKPVTVILINNRTDGGLLNIHDLYAKGTSAATGTSYQLEHIVHRSEPVSVYCTGEMLHITGVNQSLIDSKQPIIICDLLGKIVATHTAVRTIDISTIKNGMYVLKIGTFYQRFIR